MKLKRKRSVMFCVDGTDVMFLSPFSPDERRA